jgi:hypothetical protein
MLYASLLSPQSSSLSTDESWLEKRLQAVAGGAHAGRIEGGGQMRFLEGKISDRIQQRPPRIQLTEEEYSNLKSQIVISSWG